MNVLFPENDDDNNGDLALDSENEGVSSDVDVVDSNAEMTPGNTSDEEYERKFSIIIQTKLTRPGRMKEQVSSLIILSPGKYVALIALFSPRIIYERRGKEKRSPPRSLTR